jgi:heat shock protein beta
LAGNKVTVISKNNDDD